MTLALIIVGIVAVVSNIIQRLYWLDRIVNERNAGYADGCNNWKKTLVVHGIGRYRVMPDGSPEWEWDYEALKVVREFHEAKKPMPDRENKE